jgi:uncharacterized protein (TIGR02145 family)
MWGLVSFDEAYAAAGKIKYSTNNGDYYKMQDMTSSICDNVAIGQTGTLVDIRGGTETYTVARLADGKCWMTENLNIAGGTELSISDTDFELTYTLPTTDGWTVNNGRLVLPTSSTAFGTTDNVAKLYNSGNKTNCGGLNQNTPCYSYYSWDAATLGSGRSISTDNTDAPYSICPKNWKLPTAYTTGKTNWQTLSDFYVLAHQYGLDSTTSTTESDADFYTKAGPGTKPNFLLAGSYYDGSFYNGGSYGLYWSSTSSSSTNAYYLRFNSSYVSSASTNVRRTGFSVRCLAKDTTIDDLTYMQDFAALSSDTKTKVISSMDTEKTYTLKDKRDEQDYTIAKLNDGKVWMTENLNLAGGTALSADDTDVTTAYINGFTTSNNLTKTGNTIVLPASSTSGFSTDNYSYVYNSGNKSSDCSSPGCYSYYSWDAATLGSGRSINIDNENAPYSICPKGWHLPSTYNGINGATDFRALIIAYGGSESIQIYDNSTLPTGSAISSGISFGSVPNFLRAGFYSSNLLGGGGGGYYWSSTFAGGMNVRYLYVGSSSVYAAYSGGDTRRLGFSVRCLLNSDS